MKYFLCNETPIVSVTVMSHHGGKSFHGNRKRENEPPQKDKVEEDEDEEEEEDPFDSRIQKSGCADLHYALLVSQEKNRHSGTALYTDRYSDTVSCKA